MGRLRLSQLAEEAASAAALKKDLELTKNDLQDVTLDKAAFWTTMTQRCTTMAFQHGNFYGLCSSLSSQVYWLAAH